MLANTVDSKPRRGGVVLALLAIVLGMLAPLATPQPASAATAIACTDQAIGQAVATGGEFTFACGPNPVTITVSARIVTKNVSFDGGGFVTLSGNNANRFFTVNTGVTVSLSNMALRNGKYALGAGALNVLGTLNVTNVTIANNTSQQGAAIMSGSSGTVTVTNSTISDNTVTVNGGGIYNNGGTLTVTNSVVSGNVAGTGGGIYTSGNTAITGTTVSGNRASTGGGIAVYPAAGKTVTITNSTITGNTATGSSGGGGLYVYTTATLNNVTISDNSASSGSGGGMRTAGTSTLNGVTIAGNSSSTNGGGLYISGTAANIANTIVAGNTGGGSPDCYSTSTKFVSQGYNLVQNITGCPVTGDPTGNLTGVDPLLGALASNGGSVQTHALGAGSPALNAGNPAAAGTAFPACNATDGRGTSRTDAIAGRCDIGSFEAQGTPPTMKKPVVSLAKGMLGAGTSGNARVRVSWSATDADGIASYQLQHKANGGVWTNLALPTPTTKSIILAVPTASSYVFRARATDTTGATSAWSAAPVATLQLVQEAGSGVTTSGTWTIEALSGASGGSVAWADTAGASATFSATSAKGLAWVTTKGPDRGKAEVYVDGLHVTTIDLFAATYKTRQIVFVANTLPSGAHMIEIRALGTKRPVSLGTRVDLDGIVLLR